MTKQTEKTEAPDPAKPPMIEGHFTYLNEAQNVFVKEYISNGRQALAAYRAAYENNMSDAAARARAYAILRMPNIRLALMEIEKAAASSLSLTVEDHLRELASLRDRAAAARQYAAAISAEIARGKAAGLYPQKMTLQNPDGSGVFQGGTFVIPGVMSPEDWDRAAKEQQNALQKLSDED